MRWYYYLESVVCVSVEIPVTLGSGLGGQTDFTDLVYFAQIRPIRFFTFPVVSDTGLYYCY